MISINAKIRDRLTKGVKKFQPILLKAQASDINESDTVMIITDMLCDIFGYDKYENITSEFAIKKTYCDLAVKVNGKVPLLIECKAAGLELKDDHARQATNYSADSGIEWVVLTNGLHWKIFKIIFTKPIDKQLVYEFNISNINIKKQIDLEMLYYLCLESFSKSNKSLLDNLHAQKKVLNRYIIGQVMLTNSAMDSLRRTLRKLYPDINVDSEELFTLVNNEVFKREIIEGDMAAEAKKSVAKAERKLTQPKTKQNTADTEINTQNKEPICVQ
jgi:hypothetical protein